MCREVEGKELAEAEAEADNSVIYPIEPDYKSDGTNDGDEEDITGYKNHKRASLQIIADLNALW